MKPTPIPFFPRLRAMLTLAWLRWLALPAVGVALVSSVIGAGPLPPTVSLSADPLYARAARTKPTLTLVLSVEFPTVGAQFLSPNGGLDDTYTPETPYIGYFDAESCYVYNDAPSEAVPLGMTTADYKRFDRVGDANRDSAGNSLRTCDSADTTSRGFSGNFMNWASSSAVDILRRGLSGGDRIIDNASGLTVLQRAMLPTNFWNGSNFPAKKLKANLAAGAVPPGLLRTISGTTHTSDVFIANCLNRISFGTAQGGSCGTPGTNGDLGLKTAYTGSLPPGTTRVAGEGGTVTVALGSTKQIFYGDTAYTNWQVRTISATTAAVTIACTNSFFTVDPLPNVVKSCYSRNPTPATFTLPGVTSDAFLYTRVRVCESDSTGLIEPRKSMCLQYPNGYYKPVGNLQKYSDQVRVAAFGYLNDSTGNPNERYGGVLRTPMKYVGSKYFDANFSLMPLPNPNAEWNVLTGELLPNPDGALPEGRSGLINYLNQFGRSGPTPGVYKGFDPVSELYYESLRYLQGLQPTDAATSGMTDAMKDGFPVYTTWLDPHPPVLGMTDYSCVKNNIVGIGDVNTHNDKSIPGNTRTNNDIARSANLAANQPDVMAWTNVIAGFESGGAVGYLDGKGIARTTSNPNPLNASLSDMSTRNIGADGGSYYVSGLAYWANTHDIRGANWTDPFTNIGVGLPLIDKRRPGMRVSTYFLDVNERAAQTSPSVHQKNQFFLAAKYGGFTDKTDTGNPFLVSGESGNTAGNSYWESPAGTGETKNYFLSSSASAVLLALDTIFRSVAAEANSIAGGAVSSSQLTTTQDYIYRSQFDASDWSGDVVANPVSAAASGGAVSVGSPIAPAPWVSAAAVLANRTASRNIYVGGGNSSTAATNFLWGNVQTYVKTALQLGGGGALPVDPITAQYRLNYLRGDQSLEVTGFFRTRSTLIGDIVNSGVVFSDVPSAITQGSSYGSFYNDNKNRKKALFVGANDGMLHAFDAATGNELFGYIPSWVVSRLAGLTSPAYVHQSYVDATPAVADAKVGDAWKTVLVSGTGGGGQGVFALDVTDPDPQSSGASPFSANKAMWEFTDADDSDLGNVIGQPLIVPMRIDSSGATKYFAVVASGVNNYALDGRSNSTGSAALFFLDLSKPTTTGWTLNSNYYKVVFPTPSSTSVANGMANATADLDPLGAVSAIYAGDLQGKLWKLDFTKAATPADWTINKLSGYVDAGSGRAVPLYIATDGATSPNSPSLQPIMMAPGLVNGPNGSLIVAFGTGKLLEVGDISGSYKTQSVYAVLDNGATTLDASDRAIAGRGRLQAGTVSGSTVTVPDFTYGRPTADNAASGVRAGWYFDFPGSSTSGERQVSNFQSVGTSSSLIFSSVIPSSNSCGSGGGNTYILDAPGGDGTSQASTVGITGPPLVIAVADSTLGVTDTDSTGKAIKSTRYATFEVGADGTVVKGYKVVRQTVGRLSWREINNYQTLR